MQVVAGIYFIILSILAVAFFGQVPNTYLEQQQASVLGATTPQEEIVQTTPVTPTYTPTYTPTKPKEVQEEPRVLVETFIISGPKDGEIIKDTNQVTFEFKGRILSGDIEGEITFETMVEGSDTKWKTTSANKRTITFPAGINEYTFRVRAKAAGFTDPTPAERYFKVRLSPDFGKVTISTISPSLIRLNSKLNQGETINITNWQVKGMKGTVTIPKSVEIVIPGESDLTKKNIILERNESLSIWSDSTPFRGIKSFRPNKCFGYLKDGYKSLDYSPKKICPEVKLEDIGYLSDDCRRTVLSLDNCRGFDYSNNPQLMFDSTCQEYIDNYVSENLNYEGCVENYYTDENFFNKSWYFYLGYKITCNSPCIDTIYLYDENGLLVNSKEYRR